MTRLDLVVGPNGAGKSTFVDQILIPTLPHQAFVNADEIAKRYWPGDEVEKSLVAARLAEVLRTAFIAMREPFIAETVFSHPSKLDLVREALAVGYRVHLHVLMLTEDLAVARVEKRARQGGHTVPEAKIRSRYQRLWGNVVDAVHLCDTADFYDNSARRPIRVARFSGGLAHGAGSWPAWTPAALTGAWT
ncbi:AAA family ATPase [Nocardioides sp. cx-173]|uniref:AAA family ATPase n=1 Tax=Nocardioides sp. cx-173 TaxID=2898796 RepID=UPI001E49D0F4|nr:AAA family ATPase [Nocardioides sp. cx-173]MCD4527115.1 zeta toxin family protein [Nocardioides sp. cx-173]UGB42478.1 zeta toxin family protein [Nocardioides sp. cx-173]